MTDNERIDNERIETSTGHPVQNGRELCDCRLKDPPCVAPDIITHIAQLDEPDQTACPACSGRGVVGGHRKCPCCRGCKTISTERARRLAQINQDLTERLGIRKQAQ